MGFFSNLISGVVKVGLTPLAIIKDAGDVITGDESDNTKKLLKSGIEDIGEAGEDLGNGEL